MSRTPTLGIVVPSMVRSASTHSFSQLNSAYQENGRSIREVSATRPGVSVETDHRAAKGDHDFPHVPPGIGGYPPLPSDPISHDTGES